MGALLTQMRYFQQQALATSTSNTYRSGLTSYTTFCRQTLFTPFPSSELILQLYVTSLARTVSYNTIKVYLSAIQFYHIMFNFPISIHSMQRLYYLLRGIRRSIGSSRSRPLRQPITIQQLRLLLTFIRRTYNHQDSIMLSSAITLAFFGLLRCSEYTCANRYQFDPLFTLLVTNVSFSSQQNVAAIHIKSSKTDPFRSGCVVRIGALYNDICPVAALINYINIHQTRQGPLYVFTNQIYLTRNHITALLSTYFPHITNINTHSFRIGGASAAASAGVADSTIQILGRWSSDAYRRYIRISDESVQNITQRVSQVNVFTRFWDNDLNRSEPHE